MNKTDEWWACLSKCTKNKVMELWIKQLPPLKTKDLPKPL